MSRCLLRCHSAQFTDRHRKDLQPPRKDLTHGTGQSDLFWQRYPDHCELQRPEGIFGPLDLSDTVGAIRAQRKAPTTPLDADVYDAMLRTECGDLNCRCPESGRIRPMHFQGYEKSTLKRVCPDIAFEFDCQGRSERYRLGEVTASAKSRVVRTKVDTGNLRQHPALPPSTLKRKRLYRKKKCDGANQFQSGRWLHAALP